MQMKKMNEIKSKTNYKNVFDRSDRVSYFIVLFFMCTKRRLDLQLILPVGEAHTSQLTTREKRESSLNWNSL